MWQVQQKILFQESWVCSSSAGVAGAHLVEETATAVAGHPSRRNCQCSRHCPTSHLCIFPRSLTVAGTISAPSGQVAAAAQK